jgi:hypothetical protein
VVAEAAEEGAKVDAPRAVARWKRPAWVLLPLAALGMGSLVSRWPEEQTVRLTLGDASARLVELRIRYAPEGGARSDVGSGSGRAARGKAEVEDAWLREALFSFDASHVAPRTLEHRARLSNGEYRLEVDLASAGDRRTVQRTVKLKGEPARIDLSEVIPP